MTNATEEMVWHNDGHQIVLSLNKSELRIVEVSCPHGTDGPCHNEETGCIVRWFLDRFGLDCNVGVAAPKETMAIAWTRVGEAYRPIEESQVWVIPTDDEAFSAWMVTQQ